MAAYLIDHPPVRDQFYEERNRPLTGCTVLHTAESVMDTVGPDTGAEAVAEFIRTRTTAGSYHDLADSDSWLRVVPLESGAYHDGTGSNNWALSISFACGTHHWRQMSPERRAGFLRNGALAFADQQRWRAAHGYPLTDLRLITKTQSDAGMSGFTYHGLRDPGRRTDPGVAAPNLFPFDEWIDHCRAALAGTPSEEDDLMAASDDILAAISAVADKVGSLQYAVIPADGIHGPAGGVLNKLGALEYALIPEDGLGSAGEVVKRLRAIHGLVSDPAAFASSLRDQLGNLGGGSQPVSQEMLEAALRRVIGSVDNPS